MRELTMQSENNVTVNGQLVNVTSREGVTKAGKPYLSAKAIVRVHQKYLGIDEISDVTVNLFAVKFNKHGQNNPAYNSILELLNMRTIHRNGIDNADYVCFNRCELNENSYVGRNGVVNIWEINGRFINKARSEEYAGFTTEFVMLGSRPEINLDGDETGRVIIQAGIVKYGEKLDVFDLYIDDANNAEQIASNWEQGSTIRGWGRIRVVTREQKKKVSTSTWGEDAPSDTTTRTVRELVLTGGEEVADEDKCFAPESIKTLMAQRKAAREQMIMEGSQPRQTPSKVSYGWA